MDLILELNEKRKVLNTNLSNSRKFGIKYAKAEKEYKIALQQETLRLKNEGYPATIIRELNRGSEEVSETRYKRDCAKVLYESSKEAINVFKLEIRIIEDQIKREWGK